MTQLLVRKLLIDLNTPIAPRWNGGDAFRSAFFNALSMSFPVGEQYFMDAVRAGLQKLPPDAQQRFAPEVQGFVGQEATHRRIHALFNGHLEALGFDNALERRAKARMGANAHFDVRIHLAATAATEHLTAIFSDWMFRHPEALQGAEPRLQTLWMWHSAEEAEHCSTAFDLYKALGGNERHRLKLLQYITFTFAMDMLRQTVRNLWHDKALFRWSTWRSAVAVCQRRHAARLPRAVAGLQITQLPPPPARHYPGRAMAARQQHAVPHSGASGLSLVALATAFRGLGLAPIWRKTHFWAMIGHLLPAPLRHHQAHYHART